MDLWILLLLTTEPLLLYSRQFKPSGQYTLRCRQCQTQRVHILHESFSPPSYNEKGKVADYSENIFWPKQNVKLNGMTMSSLQAHLARRESVREKTIKGTS